MFKKLKCKACEEKVSKKYAYCPHCGSSLKGEDSQKFFEPEFKLGFPFNKLFKELEKQLERQFHELDAQMGPEMDQGFPNTRGISINIDTTNGQPKIKIMPMDENGVKAPAAECKNPNHHHHEHHQKVPTKIEEARAEKFSNLPREEPNTRVRRLTNKLVYEINLPGVKTNDVIISKLENSIEVKAFSEDKAFFKLIPHSLPIIGSELKEGILNLELKL